jgi:hypothetical protein
MARVGDQPKTVKRKSKKEKDKASMGLELALLSGKKSKRVCHTKDQMAANALANVVELSLKIGYTPFQKLLKLVGVISEEEEEVAMGMDNPNDLDYYERENLHEEKPYEEEPFYEEGPSELGLKIPHIVCFVAFDTTPPQEEEEEEEEGGDKEEEEAAMDKVDEKE